MKKGVDDIVRTVITTTNNTYSVYVNLTKEDSQVRELVQRALKVSFEHLKENYINPLINTIDGFQSRFDKDLDLDFILKSDKTNYPSLLPKHEIDATKKWIKRKEDEIDFTVRSFNKYKTYHLNTSHQNIVELYNRLIKKELISLNTKEIDFVNSFSGKNIDYKPQIVFNESKQALCYFLSMLMYRDVLDTKTEYNSINLNSEIFIQKGDVPFSALKSKFRDYESYKATDFKNSSPINISTINIIVSDLFI